MRLPWPTHATDQASEVARARAGRMAVESGHNLCKSALCASIDAGRKLQFQPRPHCTIIATPSASRFPGAQSWSSRLPDGPSRNFPRWSADCSFHLSQQFHLWYVSEPRTAQLARQNERKGLVKDTEVDS